MKRRTVLKALAGGTAFAPALFGKGAPRRERVAKRGAIKKIVVLFQRGGNDGLNTIIPISGGQYGLLQGLRPSVRIPLADVVSIPGNSFFGLHPSLSDLVPIIQAGNLSIIHAVGYPSPDRSHFESQSFYETAVPGNALLDGWLNRFLFNTSGPGLIRGVSIGSNIPQSVTGPLAVPVSNNFGLTNIGVDPDLGGSDVDDYVQKVRDLYNLTPTAGNDSLYANGNRIFQMIDSFTDRNLNNYVPENGAQYPNSGLGNRVMHAAQMLKDDVSFLGLEVVTIDQGGYDNHADQLNTNNPTTGRHANLLAEVGQCMSAFYTDMGPTRMDDVIFLVVTEFGRRAYQNDSDGTDHGTGAVVLVMGNPTNGQVINDGGDWPGLDNLYQGDDLMWVTDYRDIYWEILAQHVGVDTGTLNTIIPGHTHSPVGFMA